MSERAARRRVAIVGCGVAGLTSIKACLEEGLEPHCFEVNSDLGGVWLSSDSPLTEGRPHMYDSLITNTSKAMTCFSDFPCPPHYPPYLPHALFLQYVRSYAQHFDLMKHVCFNTKVIKVEKSEDYSASGRWAVSTCTVHPDGAESEEKTRETYHAVVLCQGFYSKAHTPLIPGLNHNEKGFFTGRVSHVSSYRNPEPYRGRNVVVVGSASSAGDVACDIAPSAKQVYLSVRQGAYVVPRVHNGLVPVDFRLCRLIQYCVPRWLFYRILTRSASLWLHPGACGLQAKPSVPKYRIDVMINDQLPFKMFTGQVKVVSQIQKVTETGDLDLKDGRVLTDVDDIIFATGYKPDFTVMDPSIVSSNLESGRLELYKMVFPLSLPYDTLALVGCQSNIGPIPPTLELQARLAARVFAGTHQLPETAVRQRDVDRMNQQQLEQHGYYKYSFSYLALCDELASELGVRPSVWGLLLRGEVGIAGRVMLGPALPFHFRLSGPHCWPGAREAIREAYSETVGALRHRNVEHEPDDE